MRGVVRERLESARDELIDLSHRIHANPELGYEEEQASEWLSDYLDANGFAVTKGVCDIPTAFVARYGSGPLHIAICAEYDCLPAVGHACGHNIIAAMGVGAGIAAAKVADEAGLTISVMGTPAEEGGGGKILMLERGAFEGVHASMMVHPAPLDVVELPIIAADHFDVYYTGKEAHASASPEVGINAADALTIAQTAIGLLRQHIKSTDRIHGIITKGGDAANIVPAHTSAHYMVRAKTLGELHDIRAKVNRCFEAGALATGCELSMDWHEDTEYAPMKNNRTMVEAYRRNGEELGMHLITLGELTTGSSDMGNVSQVVPSIHPNFSVGAPALTHSPEFTAAAITDAAHEGMLRAAKALAMTAIDVALEPGLLDRIKSDFKGRQGS